MKIITYSTYVMVWLGLLALTALSVTGAGIAPGALAALLPLLIAAIKALLVLAFFMHLKYEGWAIKIMLGGTVVTLAIIIGFTFIDTSFR